MPPLYGNKFSDKDAAADVAIVGLGPGGLAAALEAAASGKQVVAFSDRAEYLRGQRLVLTAPTIKFLQKYTNNLDPEDAKFWDKYSMEGTAQTKDIESFLYRKLKNYPNAQIVQLEKPDKIQAVANATDRSSSVIELSNGQKFYTRNILAADGARHDFANLMNRDLQANIQYARSPVQERHRYHGVVQLKLKFEDCYLLNSSRDPNFIPKEELATLFNNKDGCILYNNVPLYFDHKKGGLIAMNPLLTRDLIGTLGALKPDEARLATFKEHSSINYATSRFVPASPHALHSNAANIAHRALDYMKQGWNGAFEPKHYVFPNADRTKFYFAGEIPKAIFDEPDVAKRGERLQKWASHAIQSRYGYTESQLEYRKSSHTPAKDKLQATVFEMEMQVCQQSVVALSNGVFAQVGDARRTPNYNLGHGLNDAIAGGIAFVNSIDPSAAVSFKTDEFVPIMESMDQRVELAMTKRINPQQQKLLAAIDKLIDHLEKTSIGMSDENLMTLKWGRHEIENANNMGKMNEALTNIQPIIEQHQHRDTGLGYRAWRWVASIFDENAANTKSANLLSEVTDALRETNGPPPPFGH